MQQSSDARSPLQARKSVMDAHGRVRCLSCGKVFKAHRSLENHLEASHGGVNSSDAGEVEAALKARGALPPGAAKKVKHAPLLLADLLVRKRCLLSLLSQASERTHTGVMLQHCTNRNCRQRRAGRMRAASACCFAARGVVAAWSMSPALWLVTPCAAGRQLARPHAHKPTHIPLLGTL